MDWTTGNKVMIEKLKRLWQAPNIGAEASESSLALNLAVLMVEVMRRDGRLDPAEKHAIIEALEQRFDLERNKTLELVDRAGREDDNAYDLHRFTAPIMQHFAPEERIDMVRELWQVAMADGHVDPYEDQLIRRIAELIGVYHHEFIAAKIAARNDGPDAGEP
jgi:uncharacterized tellurite resistance protein B-like protein